MRNRGTPLPLLVYLSTYYLHLMCCSVELLFHCHHYFRSCQWVEQEISQNGIIATARTLQLHFIYSLQ